jgi:hypothetical protein
MPSCRFERGHTAKLARMVACNNPLDEIAFDCEMRGDSARHNGRVLRSRLNAPALSRVIV